ncbi:hypothetical protein DFH27DRAFT_204994 [Peziza echinospora]|nr:hypothetical protein DFH27DRAFT_204994 [Peziza echinospora]
MERKGEKKSPSSGLHCCPSTFPTAQLLHLRKLLCEPQRRGSCHHHSAAASSQWELPRPLGNARARILTSSAPVRPPDPQYTLAALLPEGEGRNRPLPVTDLETTRLGVASGLGGGLVRAACDPARQPVMIATHHHPHPVHFIRLAPVAHPRHHRFKIPIFTSGLAAHPKQPAQMSSGSMECCSSDRPDGYGPVWLLHLAKSPLAKPCSICTFSPYVRKADSWQLALHAHTHHTHLYY